jgi:hypothetical protein
LVNDELEGVIASDTKVACGTVICSAPRIAPDEAVIVAVPGPAPVIEPVAVATTIPGAEEVQVTLPLRSFVLPST